jgi:hypothetical protein
MDAWRANHTGGRPYSGVGWYWAVIADKAVVAGRAGDWLVATAGMDASSAELWIDGVKTTVGCATQVRVVIS